MNGDELISDVRVLVQDATEPYLWTEDTILKFLREAETLMCKGTHVLVAPDIALDVTAEVSTRTIDARILRVYAARIAGSNRALGRLRGAAYSVAMLDTLATPRHFTTNLGDRYITLYPVPDVAYTLELICAVLPSDPVDYDTDSEIPEEHQTALVDYAAYRCLIIPDEDGESLVNADIYKERWGKYVRDLKRDIYRYRTGDSLVLTHWTGNYNGRP